MINVSFTKWPYLMSVVTRGPIFLMKRVTERLTVRRFRIHKYVTLKCEFPRDPRAHRSPWSKCYGTRRCSIWGHTLLRRYLLKEGCSIVRDSSNRCMRARTIYKSSMGNRKPILWTRCFCKLFFVSYVGGYERVTGLDSDIRFKSLHKPYHF